MADQTDGAPPPTPEELARFARAPARADDAAYFQQLEARLARYPHEGREAVEQLLTQARDVDTRAWAAAIGAKVYGHDFVPTLERLFNDGDDQMQSVALMLLGEVSPAALEAHLPTLRRKLLRLKDGDDVFVEGRLRA